MCCSGIQRALQKNKEVFTKGCFTLKYQQNIDECFADTWYVQYMLTWFSVYLVMCVCILLMEGVPPGSMLVPLFIFLQESGWFETTANVIFMYLTLCCRSFIYYNWLTHFLRTGTSIHKRRILRNRTKWRLLEPLRRRLTKGFVLSESLLEKLERRLACVPDCCLRLSSAWPKGRMQRKKKKRKRM